MSSETTTLSAESVSFLTSFNEDLTPVNGFIRLSRGSYSESSEESDWASTVEIPQLLESVQSLRFIGMKKQASQEIYSRWVGAVRDFPLMPANFFDFVKGAIKDASRNAMTPEDDWNTVLKDMGVRKVVRQGILDPEFSHLRLTMSAKEWALDTADMGWRFLVNLDRTVKENKGKIIRDHLPTGAATRAGRRSQTSSDQAIDEESRPLLTTEADIPTELLGFQFLYKGADMDRLQQLSSPNEEARFLGNMLSTDPTDFSPDRAMLYLTKSKKCAYGYAEFAKRRSTATSIGVLHLAVPNDVLDDSQQIFGDDWRELVWACRGRYRYVPDHLMKYTAMPILIGPICGAGNDQILKMATMAEIQPKLLDDGTKPSQHVFQTREKCSELGVRCKDTAWVVEIQLGKANAKA